MDPRPTCRHCQRRLAYRPGSLCRRCHADHAVRRQYVAASRNSASAALSWLARPARFPPMDDYPDHGRLPACPHGLADGECPQCEREQRGALQVQLQQGRSDGG